MPMYRVRYRVSNDHEMLVSGDNEEEAKDHAHLTMDPDNQYDWLHILSIEEVNESENVRTN